MDIHVRFKDSERAEADQIIERAAKEQRSVPNMVKVLAKTALGGGKPLLKLEEKPCGDVWLHVTPKAGPLASINLGKRGDHKRPSIVQRALLAAIEQQ